MATSRDNPGVVVPPPVLYGGAFLVVLVLQWAWPLTMFRQAVGLSLGPVLLVAALLLAAWGRKTMHGAGTNISPLKPAVSIITSGPFRYTRNPLYLAMTLLYLGLTALLNSWWGILLLIPVLLILHFGVVRREELYLESKFGDPYRDYRSQVRRYL